MANENSTFYEVEVAKGGSQGALSLKHFLKQKALESQGITLFQYIDIPS